MAKRYFKELKKIGTAFCIYNIHQTAIAPVYRLNDALYFKPRQTANAGETVNGVKNLVACMPIQIGTLNGFTERINK